MDWAELIENVVIFWAGMLYWHLRGKLKHRLEFPYKFDCPEKDCGTFFEMSNNDNNVFHLMIDDHLRNKHPHLTRADIDYKK